MAVARGLRDVPPGTLKYFIRHALMSSSHRRFTSTVRPPQQRPVNIRSGTGISRSTTTVPLAPINHRAVLADSYAVLFVFDSILACQPIGDVLRPQSHGVGRALLGVSSPTPRGTPCKNPLVHRRSSNYCRLVSKI